MWPNPSDPCPIPLEVAFLLHPQLLSFWALKLLLFHRCFASPSHAGTLRAHTPNSSAKPGFHSASRHSLTFQQCFQTASSPGHVQTCFSEVFHSYLPCHPTGGVQWPEGAPSPEPVTSRPRVWAQGLLLLWAAPSCVLQCPPPREGGCRPTSCPSYGQGSSVLGQEDNSHQCT